MSSVTVSPPAPRSPSETLGSDPKRIIFASNCAYAELYAGILEYSRQHGWLLDASMLDQPGWMPRPDGCAGIIACVAQRKLLDWVVGTGFPVVHLLQSQLQVPAWPTVEIDYQAVGRMGAQHLLELGNVHFAYYRFYVDSPDINDSHDGFIREMEAHGQTVHELDFGQRSRDESCLVPTRSERIHWLEKQLRALPLPIAIMAPDDRYAVDVVFAAHALGLRIPEDLAILGSEDQPFIRGVVPDEISSVDVSLQEVGRRGCELLDRLLQGATPGTPELPLLVKVPPRGVVMRQSTATYICDHPGVTAAVRFLRTHFHEPISVRDVATHAGMSLRSLQAEYPRRVGRTVKDDILRERLKRAEFLLERTDLKLSSIAAESGFKIEQYLCRVFQQKHQVTPKAWRQQHAPQTLKRFK